MCERGETQIKWKNQLNYSKKSSSDRLTGNGEAIYSDTCRAQSNDGKVYIGVGRLNGWPVKVLRLYWMYREDCG